MSEVSEQLTNELTARVQGFLTQQSDLIMTEMDTVLEKYPDLLTIGMAHTLSRIIRAELDKMTKENLPGYLSVFVTKMNEQLKDFTATKDELSKAQGMLNDRERTISALQEEIVETKKKIPPPAANTAVNGAVNAVVGKIK